MGEGNSKATSAANQTIVGLEAAANDIHSDGTVWLMVLVMMVT